MNFDGLFKEDRHNRLGEDDYLSEVEARWGRSTGRSQFDEFLGLWRDSGRRPSFPDFFDKQK